MRIRNIIGGLALGATLTLGALAAPAQAAPAASTVTPSIVSPVEARSAAAVWHFYSSHLTPSACYNAAVYWQNKNPWWQAQCREFPGTDGVMKWHLYLKY
ncbi:hypothetical protein JOC24_003409 [Streptomyces sp. HB132]|nr:hypothetical protein [Streptomyces sp. HB132]